MLRNCITYCLIFISLFAHAQYSNDWISYEQTYYRIPITREGIYRVTLADLNKYGISQGDFNPKQIQIFHNGKSIPVYVHGEGDQIFHAEDYFEFYAESNDGWLDSAIYINNKQLNEDVSLYNDTASYFLCFASAANMPSPRYDTTSQNTNFEDFTPQTYCLRKVRNNYTTTYNHADGSPYMTDGEGWADNNYTLGDVVTKSLSTSNYIDVGLPYTLSYGAAGFLEGNHSLTVEAPGYIENTTFVNHAAIHKTAVVDEKLGTSAQITFRDNSSAEDKNTIAYTEIKYTHSLNFSNRDYMKFIIPKIDNQDTLYFKAFNFDGGEDAYIICNELNKRFKVKKDGVNYNFLIPNPGKEVECILIGDAHKSVPKIYSVQSKNMSSANFFDFTNVNNQAEYIVIAHPSLWSSSKSYANYRKETHGSAIIVDINELYNQFAYGIQKHPYAIHSFIDYAVKKWNIKPENVFIIGKGYHLPKFRKDAGLYQACLIPSMANPPSDLLFTASLQQKSTLANVAIGRLSAQNNTDVNNYFNKVKDYELSIDGSWGKNILHFGGGSDAYEQRLFKYYLSSYERLLEKEYFGAEVHTFLKESSDVFEQTEPEAVRELVNNGVAMCTFFGHASGTGFDQNIDHPDLFDNKGKYPFFLANSCYTGDVFEQEIGLSETWMLIKDKGAIGFLADVGLGNSYRLDKFSNAFNTAIAKTHYGESVGESIKYAQRVSGAVFPSSTMSFLLHGDPAIVLPTFQYPDIEVRESSLLLSPAFVTTDLQNFTANIILYNKGRATTDSFDVRITFTPDSKIAKYVIDTTVAGSYNKDTISLFCDIANFESGNYTVTIEADVNDTIFELNEANNLANIKFFISSRSVLPISPYNYAIVPNNSTELIISSVDPINPPSSILIEIDTSASYNSPLLEKATLETGGNSIVRWTPTQTFIDSVTYFWRVSNAAEIKWNEHSFTYEPNKTGWAQIHKRQFIDNNLSSLTYNEESKSYTFIENPHEIFCSTRGGASTDFEYFETKYIIDGTIVMNSGFPLGFNSLHVSVLDSATVIPWMSNKANYWHYNYPGGNGGAVRGYYSFPVDRNSKYVRGFTNLIKDSVPNNNYILIYSFKQPSFEYWDEELLSAMDSLGAKQHRNLSGDIPYIFFAQKGDTTTAVEVYGEHAKDLISLTQKVDGFYYEGSATSTKIGPSRNYDKIVWKASKVETADSTTLSFRRYDLGGSNSVVVDNRITADTIYRLDTLFDATITPMLELKNYQRDFDSRTPPKLDYWKVYYEPVGELAVAPENGYYLHADTLEQGDVLSVKITAQNISTVAMDSLLVMYDVRNKSNEVVDVFYHKIAGVNAGELISDSIKINTTNYNGDYSIKIEFNPIDTATGIHHQEEIYHFNNFIIDQFFVRTDKLNPIIDVVVDGRHVINNDYISAEPNIVISVYDDNEYLFLQDTSHFTVYVVNTQTNEKVKYYFAGKELLFVPAENNGQECQILFNPTFTEDGEYELHIQAKDASGNFAGSQEYVLKFKIRTEASVSSLYNYPNPCWSFTTFKFILTGEKAIENARIEIFNLYGHMVKEILLPNAYVGTNTVDVQWDGRDSQGIILPAGAYSYRLLFNEKDSYPHYPTENDGNINSKYGRLIIYR